MRILALDIGTTIGWACKDGDRLTSGIWDLSGRTSIHKGYRYVSLWNKLESFKQIRGVPDFLVYERPGNLFGNARKVLPAIQGIIELWALLNEVDVSDCGLSEVKKHACKGNAKKEDMMKAAKIKWPSKVFQTHDECDAFWLLDFFLASNKFEES